MGENEFNIQNCKDCLVGIGKIETRLEILNSNIMKIVYSLLAVVGANIGTKFIGTPWYIELTIYSLMFGGIFVLLITIAKRHCLTFWESWIRYSFVTLTIWVSALRIYHYQTNTNFIRDHFIVTP